MNKANSEMFKKSNGKTSNGDGGLRSSITDYEFEEANSWDNVVSDGIIRKRNDMRKSLLIIVLLLFTYGQFSFAQQFALQSTYKIVKAEVLDGEQFHVTYAMSFKDSKSQQEYHHDTRVVQIGNSYVKDYSWNMYSLDSLYTEKSKSGKSSKGLQKPVFAFNIIRNNGSNQNMISYRMFGALGTLTYEEEARPQVWNLADGTQKILGYSCHKATTNYAGRKYTAWYTVDLPLSAGPYKFFGLPGLILKVEESTGMYIWKAIGIEKKKRKIVKNTFERQVHTSKDKALKTIKRMYATPVAMLLSTGTMLATVKNGKLVDITEKDDKPIPYEPIELENK